MRKMVLVLSVIFCFGCASTQGGKLSYNMTQSLSRSGGDVSVTSLLDEGVDAEKTRQYVVALIGFIESGELNKIAIRTAAYDIATKLKITGISSYIDAIIMVIPGEIQDYEKIPEKYRVALLSFLRDGAIRGLDLYKETAVSE